MTLDDAAELSGGLRTSLDFSADPGHEQIRDQVRAFFERDLPEPAIRAADRARRIPREVFDRIAALGWPGLSIPEEFGGSGADVTYGAVLVEEVCRRFPSLGTNLVGFAMSARAVREHGTPAQQAAILPRLASGEMALAFGISEPDGGTDALRGRTRAELTPQGWKVNGRKLYTSFGAEADAVVVLCRTSPAPEGRLARGLSLILVPTDQPGFEARRMELMAHRAACTCETYYDDALAPAENLLGQEGRGFYHLIATLDEERILAAAMYVGIMQGVLDQTVQYARDRHAFGRPIGAFQALQHPIADMATEVEHARLFTMRAAWMLSQGIDCSKEAAMAKLFASEACQRATDRGMRVLAGYGLVEESPMERLFRDARLGLFSPVSNEMGRNFIGERLGLPRSY
ncbi:acyl-CoA dehydrogenase family protein [Albimonas pacifica]|uniref:Acyl-CoA dehydrogenase n=1 Tax=Albimonas pacifica TaxID=1114924 RepID=A0A1I3BP37_9RHOB|nr:acyl-CoA dehydrogenase family protein [Albimonas pacifica]SFH63856.1 Acyl-CoA dehydrogenase [Albimonas pacifica]